MRKEIIIDKSFLDKFITIYDPDNELHSDFKSFLKKVRDFDLIINYPDQQEFEKAIINNPILDLITDTKSFERKFSENLLTDMYSIEFYDNSSPIKIFMVELSSEECSQLSQKFGYEYLSTYNMSDRWKTYSSTRNDWKMKVTQNNSIADELKFDSWEKLSKFCHPLHSILILDRYILANKTNQQIKDNLFPLLKELTRLSCKEYVLNLTIITEKLYTSIENVHEVVKSFIENVLKLNCNLNIIINDRSFNPLDFEDLHPRRIFTNYFTINPDNSFNFFKSNKRVNANTKLYFEFIFNNYEWQSFKQDIGDIATYLKKVEHRPAIGTCKEIKNYYKDKENRLICN